MSWWNPTEEEAQDQYYYYRGKYNDALHDKQYWERQEENSREQLRQIDSRIVDCKAQKKSNNKQIEEIKRIIAMLEGNSMSCLLYTSLLYESPIVAWGMEPNSFSVDVTGVQTLRVMINGMNFARLEWCEIE